jgi:hypothetical protein
MRKRSTLGLLAVALLVGGCASRTATKEDLRTRLGLSFPYSGSRWYYMGTADGYDFITQTWDDFRGSPGSAMFRIRVGELEIPARHGFNADAAQWQPIVIP